jgi:glycosyltransferase involved in cell wall biosynthesis
LGAYVDTVYRRADDSRGGRVSTDRAVLLFLCEVGNDFDAFVLFGRTVRSDEPADYVLPATVDLVELPHYANLRRFFEVLRGLGGTGVGFWRGLERVDTVWAFGPHPLALLFVVLALARGKRVVLGVRQDSVRLYEVRLPSGRWAPARAAVRALDGAYRLLARRLPATVQGSDLARLYGGEGENLLVIIDSVVRAQDVVDRVPERDWEGTIELLTVGRFETEKNPLLLVRALAQLDGKDPGRYRLVWVGRGPLEDDVRRLAAELGIEDRIDFRGYVPFGPGLLDLYRQAHAFVHVSLSEGVPKVLIEALASGTPIVATDVGGVGSALEGGRAGLLVPPEDVEALVSAVDRIANDGPLRDRLASRGLELARDLTLEAEAARVASFIGEAAAR